MSRDETKGSLVLTREIRSTRDLPPGAASRTERILAAYRKWLRRTLGRLHPRGLPIDLDDVEQEVALKLWRALEREREIDDLPSYIYRIASTTTIDAMRRVRSRRETSARVELESEREPETAAPSPERVAANAVLLERIESCLEKLPENRRRAVALHLQGFTTQEVAVLLGWREPKARNLVYRGLKDLQSALREEGIEGDRG